jgi:hypothetical protein
MPDRKTALSSMTVTTHMPFLTAIKPRRGAATIALSVSASRVCPNKRMTTQLQLPRGERHPDALRAVISDWVVPLLVQEFLVEHNSAKEPVAVDRSQETKNHTGRKK